MVTLRLGFLSVLWVQATCGHDHALLLGSNPSPAALGFQDVPLNLSYSDIDLEVHGVVPAYLRGILYRGAPGHWNDGYWFDGLITLNAFKFQNGSVQYSMQWSKDDAYNNTVKGLPPIQPLPTSLIPGALLHPANASWPTGVAFHKIQDNVVGSTGVSNFNSFHSETLQPLEMPFKFSDDLGAPFLSPTHTAMIDGYLLHHLVAGVQESSGGKPSYIVTSTAPGSRERKVIATIEHPTGASFHGLPTFQHMQLATAEYYIMIENPCYYPSKPTPVGEVDWAGWHSNIMAKAQVRLVSRKNGESSLYPISHSVLGVHHLNAYHDSASNSIIIDTIQMVPSFVPCSMIFGKITLDQYVNHWKEMGKGAGMTTIQRLTVPLDRPGAEIVPRRMLNISGVEFPTIRCDDLNRKPYRFAYSVWKKGADAAWYDALLKLDMKREDYVYWHRDGHYPAEPIFVPRPGGDSEDDGVVMTNVLDVNKKESYLLLLDGKTFEEIANVGPTPHVIPHGFHGRYFDVSQETLTQNGLWV